MFRNTETESQMRKDAEMELFRLQAQIAKSLAHPVRLRILSRIGTGEVAYGTLYAELGVSKANLSQHLAVLRQSGVLSVRREGVHVHYRLTYPEIKSLCETMREVLAKHLHAAGRQARGLMRRAG
jgi:DNA-binding transcriptional ArsR family regulator